MTTIVTSPAASATAVAVEFALPLEDVDVDVVLYSAPAAALFAQRKTHIISQRSRTKTQRTKVCAITHLDEFPELNVAVTILDPATETVAFVYDEFPPETLALVEFVVMFGGAVGLSHVNWEAEV